VSEPTTISQARSLITRVLGDIPVPVAADDVVLNEPE